MTISSRKRGAPIGNTNAVKHGIYARLLHLKALAAANPFPGDLQRDLHLIERLKYRLDQEAILSPDAFRSLQQIDPDLLILLVLLARSLHHAAPDNPPLNLAIETAPAQLVIDLAGTHPNPEPAQ